LLDSLLQENLPTMNGNGLACTLSVAVEVTIP